MTRRHVAQISIDVLILDVGVCVCCFVCLRLVCFYSLSNSILFYLMKSDLSKQVVKCESPTTRCNSLALYLAL